MFEEDSLMTLTEPLDNIENVCRVCLQDGVVKSVFADDEVPKLSQKINECASIQVEQGDGLPNNICEYCISELNLAYYFRNQCRLSDTKLRRALKIVTVENGVEITNNNINASNHVNTTENICTKRKISLNSAPPEVVPSPLLTVDDATQTELTHSHVAIQTETVVDEEIVIINEPNKAGYSLRKSKTKTKTSSNHENTTQEDSFTFSKENCETSSGETNIFSFKTTLSNSTDSNESCSHNTTITDNNNHAKRRKLGFDVSRKENRREDANKHETSNVDISVSKNDINKNLPSNFTNKKENATAHTIMNLDISILINENSDNHMSAPSVSQKINETSDIIDKIPTIHNRDIPITENVSKTEEMDIVSTPEKETDLNIENSVPNKPKSETGDDESVEIKDEDDVKSKTHHECKECGKSFIFLSRLRQHEVSHSGLRPFKCEICGKMYSRKDTLISHLRTHTDKKPYQCDQCEAHFTRRNSLNKHYYIHTNVKKYNCHLCLKTFGRRDNYKIHMKTHLGVKPFKCENCPKSFIRSDVLMRHQKTHENSRKYICAICLKTYCRADVLRTHLKKHVKKSFLD